MRCDAKDEWAVGNDEVNKYKWPRKFVNRSGSNIEKLADDTCLMLQPVYLK